MISTITGRIIEINSDHLVVEIGGVGLQVFTPVPTLSGLHQGESIFLFTYLVIREESLTLVGFDNRDSRDLFILLLGVNGIGARLALSILSTLSPDLIRRAVIHDEGDVFSRVPGVGKKTAQKILFYLQDRITGEVGLEPVARMTDMDQEVLAALTNLGYSVVEAQAAIQSLQREAPTDLEQRIRQALAYFSIP